jgi:hypothetical protein
VILSDAAMSKHLDRDVDVAALCLLSVLDRLPWHFSLSLSSLRWFFFFLLSFNGTILLYARDVGSIVGGSNF